MASCLAIMAARRTASSFARIFRPASVIRPASHIPRRGLAGAAEHHGLPKANFSQKLKKEHSLIVLFAGCGLLSFGGYKLAIKSTNFAKDAFTMGILPKVMDSKDLTDNSVMDLFERWSEENGKTYKSPEEKMRRFEVFKANVKYVEEKNEHLTGIKIGLNHFSDLDTEDYMQAGYHKDLFEWWIKDMKGVGTYDSPKEKLYRFEVFKAGANYIEERNKELSYRLGLNSLSDMTHEEQLRVRGIPVPSHRTCGGPLEEKFRFEVIKAALKYGMIENQK